MAGPLVGVNTTVAAINLNVNRLLNLGQTAVLEFGVPDGDEAGGVRILRAYNTNFNRISGDEEIQGDGATIIFHVADSYPIPAGQFAADMAQKGLLLRVVNGDPQEWCKVNSVVGPSSDEAQLYVITATARVAQRTYFKR
jgi:hypothetical protein